MLSKEGSMSTIEIVDRSEMVSTLNSRLRINPETTATVAIDMHRGHLDAETLHNRVYL